MYQTENNCQIFVYCAQTADSLLVKSHIPHVKEEEIEFICCLRFHFHLRSKNKENNKIIDLKS